MIENWDRAIAHLILWEGGFADRSDPKKYAHPEYVNFGITLTTYQDEHPDATKATIRNLTEDQARTFYSDTIRRDIEFDHIIGGFDVCMLHAATMFGVHGSMAFADKANLDFGKLVVLMMQNKMHRQDGMKFMPGWSDRFVAIYDLAKELSK